MVEDKAQQQFEEHLWIGNILSANPSEEDYAKAV